MKKLGAISIEDSPAASSRGQSTPSRHILVVDDDKDVRQLSIDVLVDAGYEVESAQDGAAGWDALQSNDYDLIITDNKMPRMTGIEMLEKLRAARMALPVIMATSHLPTHEFISKPWLRPDATLQRPFTNDDLLETVRRVLRTDDNYSAHINLLISNYL
jgi:two-component system, OmpR family, alkaline phosphatase synthesis response regulator PhoP